MYYRLIQVTNITSTEKAQNPVTNSLQVVVKQ